MIAVAAADRFSSSAILTLKLLALSIMFVGHADWWLFGGDLGIHRTLGRIVFPVFGFVLAWNLRGITDTGRLWRICRRLAMFAAICTPVYALLAGEGVPFNILASYAVALAIIALASEQRMMLASAVFACLSPFVDYQWTGVAGVVFCWWWFRRSPRFDIVPLIVFSALLSGQFGNLWPMLAVPLVSAVKVALQDFDAPRLKWLFYVAYPAHLLALWLIGTAG